LISGVPGSGKSVLENIIITTSASNWTEKDVNFFFFEIASKVGDFQDFIKLKQTKCHAYTYEFAVKGMEYLINEIKNRSNLFERYHVKNLTAYNLVSQEKLPVIFVIVEEAANFMPFGKNIDAHYNEKMKCLNYMEVIASQGRASGIIPLYTLQRPDKEHMLPFMKACLNTRIVLQQLNTASSLVVMDSEEAAHLTPREAYVLWGGNKVKVKSPFFKEQGKNNDILKYLKHQIDKDHKLMDFIHNPSNTNEKQFNSETTPPPPPDDELKGRRTQSKTTGVKKDAKL
jgi:S-DNA-T family DNA segregation ATPase FtsK/SpoIIIE